MFACLATLLVASVAGSPPHIVHILVDDLGWSQVGYHQGPDGEFLTPNLDGLVEGGLELDRHYAHKICSPTRCAIQTGRAPYHVNVVNVDPDHVNPADPESGYQGIPKSMGTIAQKLKGAGYTTRFVGKWDVGMASEQHHPRNRGYDSWLGYWHHSNDYWTMAQGKCGRKSMRDLWRYDAAAAVDGPAHDLVNDPECSDREQETAKCVYEDALLTREVKTIVTTHNLTRPLFLFWAMHVVHYPLEAPNEYVERFSHIDNANRKKMAAMAAFMDDSLGEVLEAIKARPGMWEQTLVVVHSDNGGEIIFLEECGGNNWPLRGGKFSNFEGGIRVPAAVSGGMLPDSQRGAKVDALVAAWDWYATYCALAGVDPEDSDGKSKGLPPVDSINVWPLISGANSTAPRTELPIGDTEALLYNSDGAALVGGLIRNDGLKLLVGPKSKGYVVDQNVLTGPRFPNHTSWMLAPQLHLKRCTRDPTSGCLFDIRNDPSESVNIASARPDIFKEMLARVDELQRTAFSPIRGKTDEAACEVATTNYSGFWGPWLN